MAQGRILGTPPVAGDNARMPQLLCDAEGYVLTRPASMSMQITSEMLDTAAAEMTAWMGANAGHDRYYREAARVAILSIAVQLNSNWTTP